VPEWTKCSSREKRKEKKADKPFYSDSEGESGPTESADSGDSTGFTFSFDMCRVVFDPNALEISGRVFNLNVKHRRLAFRWISNTSDT